MSNLLLLLCSLVDPLVVWGSPSLILGVLSLPKHSRETNQETRGLSFYLLWASNFSLMFSYYPMLIYSGFCFTCFEHFILFKVIDLVVPLYSLVCFFLFFYFNHIIINLKKKKDKENKVFITQDN